MLAFEDRRERAIGGRPKINKVGGLSDAKVAGLVAQPKRFGSRQRRQVEQVAGIEKHAIGRDALQQVRLQSFLEHPESGAAADIGAERASHAGVDVALQGK